jgi:drug/metabolite transporter superfamily protein YnfA
MFPFAATALEKIKGIPTAFWINLGLAVLLLVALVIILRKLAAVNKMVLCAVGIVVVSSLGFNWVYERNEPKFMTPFVEKIAPFFPSKASYQTKRETAPKP